MNAPLTPRTATGAGEPPSLTGGADCASVVAQRGDSRPPRCAIAPPPGDACEVGMRSGLFVTASRKYDDFFAAAPTRSSRCSSV